MKRDGGKPTYWRHMVNTIEQSVPRSDAGMRAVITSTAASCYICKWKYAESDA